MHSEPHHVRNVSGKSSASAPLFPRKGPRCAHSETVIRCGENIFLR